MELLFDGLDSSVVVGGDDRIERPASARRIPEAAGGAGGRERILNGDKTTERRNDGEESCSGEPEELAAPTFRRSIIPWPHHFSSTSRTAYPA